jgi:hypothetical protein
MKLYLFSRKLHDVRVSGGAQVQMSHDVCGKLTRSTRTRESHL